MNQLNRFFSMNSRGVRAAAGVLLAFLLAWGLYGLPGWVNVGILVLAVAGWTRPLAGLFILLVLVGLDIPVRVPGGIVLNWSELEFAALSLAAVASGKMDRPAWQVLKWGAPFMGAVALSGVVHLKWFKVVPHVLRYANVIVGCWVGCSLLKSQAAGEAERDSAASVLLAMAVFVSLAFHAAFAVWEFGGECRPASLLGNPNQFAGYCNLLIPFGLVLYFERPRRWMGKVGALAVLLGALGLVLAMSRAGFAAGLAGMGVVLAGYLLLGRGAVIGEALRACVTPRRWVLLQGVLLIAAGGLWFSQGLNRRYEVCLQNDERTGMTLEESLAGYRMPLYRMGWRMWLDQPLLGVGPGRYDDRLGEYSRYLRGHLGKSMHVHNLYLQLAVDLGLIGLAGFLAFCAAVLLQLYRKRRNPLAWAGGAALLGLLAHGLLDVTYPSLGLALGLLLALALEVSYGGTAVWKRNGGECSE